MTPPGSAHSRFRRALETRNLIVVEAAAAELPTIGLDDALAILVLLAQAGDARLIARRLDG
jgi:hypothetical protein